MSPVNVTFPQTGLPATSGLPWNPTIGATGTSPWTPAYNMANMPSYWTSMIGGVAGGPQNAFSPQQLGDFHALGNQQLNQSDAALKLGLAQAHTARGMAGPNIGAYAGAQMNAANRSALAQADLAAQERGLNLGLDQYNAFTNAFNVKGNQALDVIREGIEYQPPDLPITGGGLPDDTGGTVVGAGALGPSPEEVMSTYGTRGYTDPETGQWTPDFTGYTTREDRQRTMNLPGREFEIGGRSYVRPDMTGLTPEEYAKWLEYDVSHSFGFPGYNALTSDERFKFEELYQDLMGVFGKTGEPIGVMERKNYLNSKYRLATSQIGWDPQGNPIWDPNVDPNEISYLQDVVADFEGQMDEKGQMVSADDWQEYIKTGYVPPEKLFGAGGLGNQMGFDQAAELLTMSIQNDLGLDIRPISATGKIYEINPAGTFGQLNYFIDPDTGEPLGAENRYAEDYNKLQGLQWQVVDPGKVPSLFGGQGATGPTDLGSIGSGIGGVGNVGLGAFGQRTGLSSLIGPYISQAGLTRDDLNSGFMSDQNAALIAMIQGEYGLKQAQLENMVPLLEVLATGDPYTGNRKYGSQSQDNVQYLPYSDVRPSLLETYAGNPQDLAQMQLLLSLFGLDPSVLEQYGSDVGGFDEAFPVHTNEFGGREYAFSGFTAEQLRRAYEMDILSHVDYSYWMQRNRFIDPATTPA